MADFFDVDGQIDPYLLNIKTINTDFEDNDLGIDKNIKFRDRFAVKRLYEQLSSMIKINNEFQEEFDKIKDDDIKKKIFFFQCLEIINMNENDPFANFIKHLINMFDFTNIKNFDLEKIKKDNKKLVDFSYISTNGEYFNIFENQKGFKLENENIFKIFIFRKEFKSQISFSFEDYKGKKIFFGYDNKKEFLLLNKIKSTNLVEYTYTFKKKPKKNKLQSIKEMFTPTEEEKKLLVEDKMLEEVDQLGQTRTYIINVFNINNIPFDFYFFLYLIDDKDLNPFSRYIEIFRSKNQSYKIKKKYVFFLIDSSSVQMYYSNDEIFEQVEDFKKILKFLHKTKNVLNCNIVPENMLIMAGLKIRSFQDAVYFGENEEYDFLNREIKMENKYKLTNIDYKKKNSFKIYFETFFKQRNKIYEYYNKLLKPNKLNQIDCLKLIDFSFIYCLGFPSIEEKTNRDHTVEEMVELYKKEIDEDFDPGWVFEESEKIAVVEKEKKGGIPSLEDILNDIETKDDTITRNFLEGEKENTTKLSDLKNKGLVTVLTNYVYKFFLIDNEDKLKLDKEKLSNPLVESKIFEWLKNDKYIVSGNVFKSSVEKIEKFPMYLWIEMEKIIPLLDVKNNNNKFDLRLDDYENGMSNQKKYMDQFTNLIKFLHVEKKVIHGDIKPENIGIHNGTLKLFDFGRSSYFGNEQTYINRMEYYDSKAKKIIMDNYKFPKNEMEMKFGEMSFEYHRAGIVSNVRSGFLSSSIQKIKNLTILDFLKIIDFAFINYFMYNNSIGGEELIDMYDNNIQKIKKKKFHFDD